MLDCHGNGSVVDDACECDRYYTASSNCRDSFRDVYGDTLFGATQLAIFVAYACMGWLCLRQLQRIRWRWDMRCSSMVCLVIATATRCMWAVDPYAWSGTLSETTALLLNNIPYLAASWAVSSTIAYWGQLLRSQQLRTQMVSGAALARLTGGLFLLIALSTVLLFQYSRTSDPAVYDLYNLTMSLAALIQSVVLIASARRVRGQVALLVPSELRVPRLMAMVTLWYICGALGVANALVVGVFVAVDGHESPWGFYAVMFVAVRLGMLGVLTVLYASYSVGESAMARIMARLARAGCCWWWPTRLQRPLRRPPPRLSSNKSSSVVAPSRLAAVGPSSAVTGVAGVWPHGSSAMATAGTTPNATGMSRGREWLR